MDKDLKPQEIINPESQKLNQYSNQSTDRPKKVNDDNAAKPHENAKTKKPDA